MINYNRLKELREKAGLSEADFAEQIGVIVATLQGYETGRINPSVVVTGRIQERLSMALVASGHDLNFEDVGRLIHEGAHTLRTGPAEPDKEPEAVPTDPVATAWEEGRACNAAERSVSECPYRGHAKAAERVAWFQGYFGEPLS